MRMYKCKLEYDCYVSPVLTSIASSAFLVTNPFPEKTVTIPELKSSNQFVTKSLYRGFVMDNNERYK
jgi:hypothetical protein